MALKASSDRPLKLRIFFAIELRATLVEFVPENIVIAAGINKLNFLLVLSDVISVIEFIPMDYKLPIIS